ncbi:hypothetical protein AX769_16325 [Frondihabitans sp. PAMC 28766]|uniref:GNAT family N-acetyltransferase n=1 Tax=Frondihabitans sp. PAMC 28766 TaxID=1795630 RepID=UPI00078E847F|nr:GNAT family N-acetyltransferase [Frondihabitans sp. PAMC 28766]AMM21408.1 hypothetical protein AX769_16325 [Frondihabitans sp. PAMC 28766]
MSIAEPARTRPLTDDEFAAWRDAQLADYAESLERSSGISPESARARSEKEFFGALPDGLQTARMHVLAVLDAAGEKAGVLWVGPHPSFDGSGYVYDIVIEQDHRGAGLGRATMLAAEEVSKAEGWSKIGLNVFGDNEVARGLYDSLGYAVASTRMIKPL